MVNGVFICDFVFGNVEPTMNGGKWIMAPTFIPQTVFVPVKRKETKTCTDKYPVYIWCHTKPNSPSRRSISLFHCFLHQKHLLP